MNLNRNHSHLTINEWEQGKFSASKTAERALLPSGTPMKGGAMAQVA
jgi:hypothetical protein